MKVTNGRHELIFGPIEMSHPHSPIFVLDENGNKIFKTKVKKNGTITFIAVKQK